ncbi:hypothetical protein GGE12_001051 [Rhizobium mongolense]|uniref:Uncharacterized protein n=1 Tax=Rhizobium mongolense TaxID=57676 RepID=A0A7W6RIW6_9HYPH|nr:hypothetical protein [Rhizobium mongolense]
MSRCDMTAWTSHPCALDTYGGGLSDYFIQRLRDKVLQHFGFWAHRQLCGDLAGRERALHDFISERP